MQTYFLYIKFWLKKNYTTASGSINLLLTLALYIPYGFQGFSRGTFLSLIFLNVTCDEVWGRSGRQSSS